MLKVERSTDYLKGASLEITEPIEEEQNTQQSSKSFQPKPRIRRQYSPNDNNLQLLSLIARYKQDPALISDIKGLLNKVDINYRDKDGDTFLHAAIQEEHQDVVKLILEKGARIDIENNAGKTPLSLANELDNRNPNKQSIIQMLDQSRQKDDKRKRKQPPSDPNKRQKFDQDNSFQFAEKTLNQQDYQVWLTQEDIANIARIKYGWYGENSNVLFEVIGSVGQLDVELKRHKEIPKAPSKQSLIFIINLNSNHWVTLVIIHQNQQFSAYYINSFGDEITSDIRDKLNSAMPGIQISNPKFKQQEDGYNCGIFALENARIINDKIKSGKTNLEIEQALKGYELTSDDLKNKRKEFAEELQQQKAKLNYEGSTLNDSSAKKSSSTEIQKPKAVKRPNNDQEVPNKKVKPSSQKYSKSGLVYTLHGDIYQLKLLMLFVKRGLDRGYLFELATEMDIAEKFDDLVFQYKKNNADRTEEKVGRFLQAKHKQDEDKRISVNDLLTEKNGEFSLQKYFISYRKIQQNLEFKNSNLQYKDFIICTNIGFKFGDKRSNLELSEDIFDHETDENEILNTKLFQFKDEFTGREEIFSVLRSAPDLTKLAKGLAECVLDGKSINDDKSKDDPEGNLFKSYQSALIDKVIDKESYKLSVDFVKGQQLSSGAENLRAAFKKVFDDRRKSFNLDDKPIIKDPENFAQEIAKLIESQPNKVVKVEKRKHVIKDNFDKLAGYVLIKKDNKIKFSTAFLNDHELPVI